MTLKKSNAAASLEQDDDTTAQQRAFIRSAAPGDIFGIELKPFDALRQTAALAMGLRYGMVGEEDLIEITQRVPAPPAAAMPPKKASKGKQRPGRKKPNAAPPAPGKAETQTVVIYAQFLADVITVLWLCSNEHSVAFRARRKPEEAVMESTRWATKKGIVLGNSNFAEAAKLFGQIMGDVDASRSEPEQGDGGDSDDSGN